MDIVSVSACGQSLSYNVCEFWTTSNDCIVCTGLVCSQNFLSTHFYSSILPHNVVQCSAFSSNDRIAK